MANIIEHGPSGLVAAAQVMGAGAAGMTQGIMLGQEYQKKQLQIQQAQNDLQASQMQMDAYRRQQQLREQASTFLAQAGEAGQALLAFQDTGDTGIPGVKRNPLQMPPDLFQIWRQGDAETRELIQNEWAMMRGAADYQAITNHVRSQADDILNGRGVYGASENNPYMPQAAQAIEAVAPQVQEILEEMEAGLLSPQEANAQLNQIQSSLFDTVRNGQTKAAILGAFSAKIEQAYGFGQVQQGQGALLDFGSRDSGYAEYLQAMQKMYQDGHLTPTQAMAILKLNPNEYEALLQMGHGLAQRGGAQGQPYTGQGVNIQGPGAADDSGVSGAPVASPDEEYLKTGKTPEDRDQALNKALADRAKSAYSQIQEEGASDELMRRFGLPRGKRSKRDEEQQQRWIDLAASFEIKDGETEADSRQRVKSGIMSLLGPEANDNEVAVAMQLLKNLRVVKQLKRGYNPEVGKSLGIFVASLFGKTPSAEDMPQTAEEWRKAGRMALEGMGLTKGQVDQILMLEGPRKGLNSDYTGPNDDRLEKMVIGGLRRMLKKPGPGYDVQTDLEDSARLERSQRDSARLNKRLETYKAEQESQRQAQKEPDSYRVDKIRALIQAPPNAEPQDIPVGNILRGAWTTARKVANQAGGKNVKAVKLMYQQLDVLANAAKEQNDMALYQAIVDAKPVIKQAMEEGTTRLEQLTFQKEDYDKVIKRIIEKLNQQ